MSLFMLLISKLLDVVGSKVAFDWFLRDDAIAGLVIVIAILGAWLALHKAFQFIEQNKGVIYPVIVFGAILGGFYAFNNIF